MAQKTAFTSALEAIIEALVVKARPMGAAELDSFGISEDSSDPNKRDIQLCWSMIYDHGPAFNAQFQSA